MCRGLADRRSSPRPAASTRPRDAPKDFDACDGDDGDDDNDDNDDAGGRASAGAAAPWERRHADGGRDRGRERDGGGGGVVVGCREGPRPGQLLCSSASAAAVRGSGLRGKGDGARSPVRCIGPPPPLLPIALPNGASLNGAFLNGASTAGVGGDSSGASGGAIVAAPETPARHPSPPEALPMEGGGKAVRLPRFREKATPLGVCTMPPGDDGPATLR